MENVGWACRPRWMPTEQAGWDEQLGLWDGVECDPGDGVWVQWWRRFGNYEQVLFVHPGLCGQRLWAVASLFGGLWLRDGGWDSGSKPFQLHEARDGTHERGESLDVLAHHHDESFGGKPLGPEQMVRRWYGWNIKELYIQFDKNNKKPNACEKSAVEDAA